jgi:hypothetical protein
MEAAFAAVVVVVSVVAFAAAAVALATSRGAYDGIGRGPLAVEDPSPDDAEVEDLRQLVEAGNVHRAARGEPPLDVEAEVLARLRAG